MVLAEQPLQELIEHAKTRGYTIPSARIIWTHNLRKATIRVKITPWPDYDQRTGEGRHTFSGTIDKVRDFIYELPEL